MLVEVLSEATRDYDRGEKLLASQSIATLRDVLLVDQNAVHVERGTARRRGRGFGRR